MQLVLVRVWVVGMPPVCCLILYVAPGDSIPSTNFSTLGCDRSASDARWWWQIRSEVLLVREKKIEDVWLLVGRVLSFLCYCASCSGWNE